MGKFQESATYHDHTEGVWSLDYSNAGNFLVSASPDKSVLIWDTKKASASQKLLGHQDKVYSAKISEDDKLIASVGTGAELLIWDVAKPNQPIKKLNLGSQIGYDISWSNNGDYLFVTTMGARTVAIDSKTFTIVDEHRLDVEPDVQTEGVCSNWKTLPGKVFVGCEEGLIIWYQFENGKLHKEIEFVAHVGTACRNVNLHPHSKYMLSSGKDGSVRLWNCNNEGKPKIQANLVHHEDNVTSPIFVGDEIVVTGSWDQSIGIWNFKDLINK